jgi:Flp pilus assembly protein TadD
MDNQNRSPEQAGREKALAGIVFISLPLNLRERFDELGLDPQRLLPVETGADDEKWNIAELTWEMIVSGMLKILAWQPDHEDAAYYRQFIAKVKPDLQRELTDAGIVKARNHDYALAEEIFRALVGLAPGNSRYLLNLALLFEERAQVYRNLENHAMQDEYEQLAQLWYRNALSLDEVVNEAYLYAGYFHLRHNNFGPAREALGQYLKVGTDEEQKAKAAKALAEIDNLDQRDNLFKEAYDFIRMDREEEGIEKITEFLGQNPTVWNAWFILGWANRRLGHWEAGRDAFEKACANGGENADTLNELAICQMEAGDFAQSRKSLEKALRLEPDNTKIMSNLGILCLKQDQPQEALAFFRTVLEFDPEDTIAQGYLEQLEDA